MMKITEPFSITVRTADTQTTKSSSVEKRQEAEATFGGKPWTNSLTYMGESKEDTIFVGSRK